MMQYNNNGTSMRAQCNGANSAYNSIRLSISYNYYKYHMDMYHILQYKLIYYIYVEVVDEGHSQ